MSASQNYARCRCGAMTVRKTVVADGRTVVLDCRFNVRAGTGLAHRAVERGAAVYRLADEPADNQHVVPVGSRPAPLGPLYYLEHAEVCTAGQGSLL